MKLKYLAVFLLIVMLGSSCARIADVWDRRPVSPDQALFESAEHKYAESRYDEALVLYEAYLEEYPEAVMVPGALMKIGIIRTQKKEYEASREIYARVIQEYPETDFAGWARVEYLYSYYHEGRNDLAADYAQNLRGHRFTPEMRVRINTIAGYVYMENKAYGNAVAVFIDAFSDASEAQRPFVGERLMEAASFLEIDALQAILDRLRGKEPAGYLTYQKGLLLAGEGRIGEALQILSDFSKHFPMHPLSDQALEKALEFQGMAYFEGHRIGVLLPLTGQYETFGRSALRGIELALSEFSERAEIDPPLEIVVYDTGADPRETVRGVAKLAEQQVAAIIGPIVMADAAVGEAQKIGIPIIALSQRDDVTKAGDYVFRNFLTPGMQVDALVAYTTGMGLKRYAILYPDEAYGEMFLHLFWDKLLENGGIVVGVEKYDAKKTDFSTPIKKLVGLYHEVPEELQVNLPLPEQLYDTDIDFYEEVPGLVAIVEDDDGDEEDKGSESPRAIVDFDAVFIPDSAGVAGLIIPQLRYYDISDVYLVGTNLWHSERLITTAGRQLRKVVIPEGFFAQSRKPQVIQFVTGFSGIYGDTPGFIEASAYDSAKILFGLITEPGIDNRVAVKNALLKMPPFDGVTGRTRFDDTGEAVKDLYLLEVTRGRFLEIRQ